MARKNSKQIETLLDQSPRPWAECFLLCDYARSENGKLYIVGGGWDRIVPQRLPFDYEAYLAIKLALPWDGGGDSTAIRVELLGKNGRVLGDPVFAIAVPGSFDGQHGQVDLANEGQEPGILVANVFLATGVNMTLAEPGRFILRLVVNDVVVVGTSFVVERPMDLRDQDVPAPPREYPATA